MEGIAAASREQHDEISSVNEAMTSIAEITNKNSINAQQTSAAASKLSKNAKKILSCSSPCPTNGQDHGASGSISRILLPPFRLARSLVVAVLASLCPASAILLVNNRDHECHLLLPIGTTPSLLRSSGRSLSDPHHQCGSRRQKAGNYER